jgi:hypothetical protein
MTDLPTTTTPRVEVGASLDNGVWVRFGDGAATCWPSIPEAQRALRVAIAQLDLLYIPED